MESIPPQPNYAYQQSYLSTIMPVSIDAYHPSEFQNSKLLFKLFELLIRHNYRIIDNGILVVMEPRFSPRNHEPGHILEFLKSFLRKITTVSVTFQ